MDNIALRDVEFGQDTIRRMQENVISDNKMLLKLNDNSRFHFLKAFAQI